MRDVCRKLLPLSERMDCKGEIYTYSQFRRDVSSFISQHTCATRALNPSRFLPARNETGSRKQNMLFPHETRGPRDNSLRIFPVTFGFSDIHTYIHIRATASVYRWIAGYLHIRVRPLSPFSNVSSYRYANTSNLDFTT